MTIDYIMSVWNNIIEVKTSQEPEFRSQNSGVRRKNTGLKPRLVVILVVIKLGIGKLSIKHHPFMGSLF
ncbi:hypothetical protein G7B40_012000 [Aetokthonos hydrillicola Thurmond2011]|jgi:hypothetical protein|uniref:Uncharacterized protein n=1 Tax=Aetokthonos hydrillicola Thurmond2011 TaxID=2712845 RepID=A0AAP5I589_9CYAN|nr:hypothetical protein [Aetokthonos hydrillicola]MBO3459089.1 hypothetical protein [Aetokthonos hydrillicola CCALA 1050]MBW4584737.1 hypothetical protein [Aetokthonos hydrillicola CCALA 1050]MDR9895283.1 hypothetical protein [Aetokthonos hydrillicola Thurmond2011]